MKPQRLDVTETTDDLSAWAYGAQPGARVIFHTGAELLPSVARGARQLREAGLITTCQRRCPHEPSWFEHIAIRVTKPRVKK